MKPSLHTSLTKSTVLLLLCLICFTGSVCDPVDAVDEGPCGEETGWDMIWTSGGSNPKIKWTFGLEGETRTVVLYQDEIPEDVCSDEHVRVVFYASTSGLEPGAVNIFGETFWSLFGRTTHLVQESVASAYHAEQDVGLKQAFPDKPGYLSSQLKFTFKSRGGAEVDSTYLASHLIQVAAHITYKKFKEK